MKTPKVSTVIAAYNLGMNGVDRVDQLRSTNPRRRKKRQLYMNIFTWALDLCVIYEFALFNEVQPNVSRSIPLREFKRRICEAADRKATCMHKRAPSKQVKVRGCD